MYMCLSKLPVGFDKRLFDLSFNQSGTHTEQTIGKRTKV